MIVAYNENINDEKIRPRTPRGFYARKTWGGVKNNLVNLRKRLNCFINNN